MPSFKTNDAIFRTNDAIFQTNDAIFQTDDATFQTNDATFRTDDAIFQTDDVTYCRGRGGTSRRRYAVYQGRPLARSARCGRWGQVRVSDIWPKGAGVRLEFRTFGQRPDPAIALA